MGERLQVLDLFRRARVRLAGSASGQAVRGTSGKAPRPSRASCSPLSATRRFGDDQACGPRPERASLRKPDKREAHQGDAHRTGSGCRLDLASPQREHSRQPWCRGSSRKTLTGSRARFEPSIPASNASGSRRRGWRPETASRIGGRSGLTPHALPSCAAIETSSRSRRSTTSQWRDPAQTVIRKSRSASKVWS